MHVIHRRGWEIPESHATPEHLFFNRRAFLGAAAAPRPRSRPGSRTAQRVADLPDPTADLYPCQAQREIHARPADHAGEKINGAYNNFYEFGSSKDDRQGRAGAEAPALDDQDRRHGGEAGRDRHRRPDPQDADGGAALSPSLRRGVGDGDSVVRLPARQAGGAGEAAVVGEIPRDEDVPRFVGRARASARPGIRGHTPKGLTIAEATNELAFLATGAYGKPMPKQHGAPLRLAVPWKYGFKSIKSIDAFQLQRSAPEELLGGVAGGRVRLLGQRQSGSAASALEPGDRGRHRAPSSAARPYCSTATANTSPTSTRDWKRSSSGSEALTRVSDQLVQKITPLLARRLERASSTPRPRKNRALAGPVVVCRLKPTITFQRGTAGCIAIATWEEQRPVAYSAIEYGAASRLRTTRKAACQPCDVAARSSRLCVRLVQKFHCCAFATRKSRNTWMRATDLSSSG